MPDARDLDLPDLVAGVIGDARELVEAQVGSLREDLGQRLGDLGTAIKSWLFVVCVAIVTAMLLGTAIAATLTQVAGLPWWISLWIVTALAVSIVVALVSRERPPRRQPGDPPLKSQELITLHAPQARTVDEVRDALNEKLGELHRRAVHAKQVVTPATYVANPWLRIGVGLVAGAVVGDQVRRGGLAGALALLGLGAIAGRAFTSYSERARDAASPAP